MKTKKEFEAFSLVEILVAIGLFTISMFSVVYFSMDARRGLQNSKNRVEASIQIQSFADLISIYKYNNWGELSNLTGQGPKGISLNNNNIVVTDTPYISGDISIYFEVSAAYRDALGEIASTGTEDGHTRIITIVATWDDIADITQTLDSVLYLNDWHTRQWLDTTADDFNLGTLNQTVTTDYEGGEVQLETYIYGNWCNPTQTLYEYDIPGTAYAKTITAEPGYAYLGTGGVSTGISFTQIAITGVEPPVITIVEEFDNYLINNIFIDGDYAYLATDEDGKEIVILDISNSPYQEVGYFNASGSTNSESVWVIGNVGYMAQGRYLRTFDLTQKTGSRPQLDSVKTGAFWWGYISQIVVKDGYAFLSMYNDWYEVIVVNITDPNNISISDNAEVNYQQAHDLFVRNDGDRVFFGTLTSSWGHELFILNSSNRTNLTQISGVETNGMDVYGIEVSGDYLIIVGHGGEEYQVWDISDETNPTQCGGMDIDDGINDIILVTDAENNVFSYIITNDQDNEFKIIRGGIGGGGADGYGFVATGDFESQVFDSGSDINRFYMIDVDSTVPAGSTLQLQIRAGNTPDLSSTPWVGPDGTSGTFYDNPQSALIPQSLINNRYFQYKLYFTSDTDKTATFKEFRLTYQP